MLQNISEKMKGGMRVVQVGKNLKELNRSYNELFRSNQRTTFKVC